jgi:hypothetical protein
MSITEKDKDMTADYKDTEVTAFLKKIIVCILDFALFSVANLAMCYLTQNGHITLSSYGKIAFNYPHFIMVGVMAVIVVARALQKCMEVRRKR